MVVDNVIYRLSISPSIPEILALKVESCPKLRQIFDIIRYPKFQRGGALQNLYARYQPHLALHHVAKFH